jgi:hypothetical protein
MKTAITSLRVAEKVSVQSGDFPDIPYLIVNLTWKVSPNSTHFQWFLDDTKDIVQQLSVVNPEKWDDPFSLFEIEFEKVWIPHGDRWKYIPKFNTFWYKDYVSDCPVVRATLKELEHFQQREEFSSEYRFFDESILYKHLSVLCTFTD